MKYFAFDDRIVKPVSNAVLKYGAVEKSAENPLFGEDYFKIPPRPWEARFDNGYPSVIYDSDAHSYKCWYTLFINDRATTDVPPEKRPFESYQKRLDGAEREMGVCYAVSEDGIHWQKPELNLISFDGSTKNNLVMRDIHGAGIMKDARDPDASRRYKALLKSYSLPGNPMCVSFSPDGLSWTPPKPWPEFNAPGDCHNNAFWDGRINKYVGITRLWRDGLRVVGRTESADFLHWSEPKEVFSGDGLDDQIYSMPVFPYEGIYLGLPSVYRGDKASPDYDTVGCALAWSPDTVRWHRLCPGDEFIPRSPGKYPTGAYDCGCVYAAAYPIFKDGETLFYYIGSNGLHTAYREGSLALARLKIDRFAGYEPLDKTREAVVLADPPKAGRLRINAEIYAGGYVKTAALPDTAVEFHIKNAKLFAFELE